MDYSQLDIAELTRLANAGDTAAQRTLGQRFLIGERCKLDAKTGLEWLERAANQHDAEAQYALGTHEWGMDNLPTAESWWQKAAGQKHPKALYWLGELCATARPPDYNAAALWYDEAAECGNEDAMNALGEIYLEGKGNIPKSAIRAKQLFEKAGKLGCHFALVNLTKMYRNGIGVSQDLKKATEYERLGVIAEAKDSDLSGNLGIKDKSNGSGIS